MAAELQPKTPPSPELIAALTWLTQNLWAAVCFLIVALGRVVFGNLDKKVDAIVKQNEEQDKEKNAKLDLVIEKVSNLAREVSEIKGELKAKEKK